MNPETTIRPWLLACLDQFGCKRVEDYRWSDPSTRPEAVYCHYMMVSSEPNETGYRDLTADPSPSYNVNTRYGQAHTTTIQIDLYISPNGLYELAACAVGARTQKNTQIFEDYCAFKEVQSVTNESEYDDEDIYYHHRMICTFNENIEISITDINAFVDQIDLTLESDSKTYEITRSGITQT